MGRLFGTDGVRGIAGQDMTCELAMDLGRAAATVLTYGRRRRPLVVLGKDTRISSDMLGEMCIRDRALQQQPMDAAYGQNRRSEHSRNGRTPKLLLAAAPADQHPCAVPDRRGNKRNGDHMCGTADKDKDAAKNTAHKNRVLPFLNHFACPLFLTLHDFYRICKHY